jgi:hypothetical protein
MARLLIALGLLLLAVGSALLLFPRALSWFGTLPGDIDVQWGNTRVFIPLTSMLVVSAGLTLLVNLIGWVSRLFR